MTYRIIGLDAAIISPFRNLDDAQLAAAGARRVVASSDRGFPCRTSLRDAEKGESLILFNYVSHDVETPYRSSYAIFIREAAGTPLDLIDSIPPVFEGRPLALRQFDRDGMLQNASLADPGDADQRLCEAFSNPDIAYVDVHNAAHGCFAARAKRA